MSRHVHPHPAMNIRQPVGAWHRGYCYSLDEIDQSMKMYAVYIIGVSLDSFFLFLSAQVFCFSA